MCKVLRASHASGRGSARYRRGALLGAAVLMLLAIAPGSASAAFTLKSAETECIFQQHWETTSNGTRYINVDKGACFIELTITHTPDVCPPGPNGEDTSAHWGIVERTRYYKQPTDFSENQQGQHVSGGTGQTRTWRTSLGVSSNSQDLFTEVNGERVLGTDLWRARVGCANSADAVSGTQAITLIVRGPNYRPPSGGGGGGGTGGSGGGAGAPPPVKPCPEADRLLFQWKYWDLAAQVEQGMALKAEQAVIDYANKGFATFLSFFNLIEFSADPIREKALYEQYRLELEGAINKERGFDQADRQLKVIKANIGLFKALGVVSTGQSAILISEGLYYLGLAAQKGLERDVHRENAKAALEAANSKRESALLARRACDVGAARANAAGNSHELTAKASAKRKSGSKKKSTRRKKKRIYMKQVRPKVIAAVHLRKAPGLGAGVVRTLNGILAGQSRTTALAQAIGESVRRAGLARKARSSKWEIRQQKWARGYATKLALHLEVLASKRESAARSLTGAALLETRLRFADPAALSKLLGRIGLPVPLRVALKQLGLSESPFLRLWTALPGSEIVAPSLAETVGDAEAIAADRAWAADLRRFAAGPQ